MDKKIQKLEFIGAFFLVFAVGMVTLIPGAGAIAPFVAGLTLLLMITIGGRISGGHYNPAVTLACLLKGDIGAERAVYYWVFQLIGAGIASVIVLFLKDYPSTTYLSVSIWHVLIVEFIYTFALVFAALVTSLVKHPLSALLTAVAVGLVVATGGVTVGSISGGAFNPAVVFGSAIMGIYAWETIWVFLLANIVGSFVAAVVVFKLNWVSSPMRSSSKEISGVVSPKTETTASSASEFEEVKKDSLRTGSRASLRTGSMIGKGIRKNKVRLLRYKNL